MALILMMSTGIEPGLHRKSLIHFIAHRFSDNNYRCDLSLMSPRAEQPDDARSITRNMRNLPIAAPIRSKYMYSDMMYTALTLLVESKTGQRFGDYLQERFFGPLQMTSTNLQPGTAKDKGLGPRMATAYCWDRENKSFKAFDNPDRPEGQGAGSVITSVNDYIKWVKALMLHESPVTENMYNELIRSRSFLEVEHNEKWLGPFTSQTTAGAGLEMFYYRGYLVVGHNGLVQGFASRHFFLPQFKFGVVIFANSSSAGRIIEIISRELIDAALAVPVAERHDWSGSIALIDPDGAFERRVKRMDEAVRASFTPDSDESSENQTLPLDAYVGVYKNKGFHNLTVQIKERKLFIDASDRSFGFTMTLDHVCDQRKYVAHRSDFFEGGDTPIRAEFILENGRPVRLGLELEEELEELIWFDKIK